MVYVTRERGPELPYDSIWNGAAMGSLCRKALPLMSRPTRYELTGVLLEGRVYPVLRVDGGGEWQLDVTKSWRHFLGKRVTVKGARDGFDVLAVDAIGLV
ncbi:hypothetical protein BH11PSE5_BH11PSE5_16960 [soil metagenome]|jgi:hypothetical protein